MKLLTTTVAAAAAAAALAFAGSASAQDVDVSFNAAVTSDYVFRGFSQTNEDAAIQGGVDLTIGSFYAGAWASNVDFGDNTEAEIDIYGGMRGEAAGYAWDAGIIFYTYTPGANGDYDYVELKAAASRSFGSVTGGAAVYYSPDFFGADDAAVYAEANWAYATPVSGLAVTGALGKQWLDVSDDYITWNVGATYTIPSTPVAVDLRYTDTDIDGLAIAEDRFVGTLKVAF